MLRTAATLLIIALGTHVVRADPKPDDDQQASVALIISADCKRFTPPSSTEHPMFWDRWLSLASCLLDSNVSPARNPLEVRDMVAELMDAFQPSMLMWQRALDRAPLDTQLRAGYHVGLAMVAFMTRARSSLVAPDYMTEPDALRREASMRAKLEPLLAIPKRVAWTAFTAIVDHASQAPEFERNPVHRAMVWSARTYLGLLERPGDLPVPAGPAQTVRAIR